MKTRILSTCLAMTCWLTPASGQDIDMSGHVVNVTGAAVAGASVTLVKQAMTDTTDNSGAYAFRRIAAIQALPGMRRGQAPVLAGNRLRFGVERSATPVRIGLFDASGRLLAAPVTQRLAPGAYEVPLSVERAANRVWFVRANVGGTVSVLQGWGQGGASAGQHASSSPGLAKGSAGPVDTLLVLASGYLSKKVLVQSYVQNVTIALDTDNGLLLSINNGDPYVVKDTCSLLLRDRGRRVASVRFSDSVAGSVPVFGVASSRNSTAPLSVSDTAQTYQWVLAQGFGTKTVYAELSFADSTRDTLLDLIAVRPWKLEVTLRNDTAGQNMSMRRMPSKELVATTPTSRSCDAYGIYRPWVDFCIGIDGDSSFTDTFYAYLCLADSSSRLDATSLRATKPRALQWTGVGPAHDASHIYRYSFCPDSAEGVANLDTLRTGTSTAAFGAPTASPNPQAAYGLLQRLSQQQRITMGRKEFAVIVEARGKYFGDSRRVVVSGRVSPDVDFVSYYDAYPPMVKRDYWVYIYPDDGAIIDSAIDIDLNTDGDIYVQGQQVPERGLVWDMGGADVSQIDVVFTEMSDSMAAVWSDTVSREVTLDQVLSRPHHSFGFPIPTPSPKVCPVRWYGIDPSQWNDGWYLVTFITRDSFGNVGIAPYVGGTGQGYGSGRNRNPQHWRIVTQYHDLGKTQAGRNP
jgi:hypothetical protein